MLPCLPNPAIFHNQTFNIAGGRVASPSDSGSHSTILILKRIDYMFYMDPQDMISELLSARSLDYQ